MNVLITDYEIVDFVKFVEIVAIRDTEIKPEFEMSVIRIVK